MLSKDSPRLTKKGMLCINYLHSAILNNPNTVNNPNTIHTIYCPTFHCGVVASLNQSGLYVDASQTKADIFCLCQLKFNVTEQNCDQAN